MMGLARFGLKNAKPRILEAFGSGTGEGFTPIPNFSVYGILASGKVKQLLETLY